MLSVLMEETHEFLHSKLTGTTLTTLNSLVGQFTLLFLKVQNTFFNGIFDGDLVNNNIDLLSETMDSVNSLLLNELGNVKVSPYWKGKGCLRDSRMVPE